MFEFISLYPIISALLALGLLAAAFGAVLGFAAIKFKVEGDPLVEQIDELLPQTQCGQCGHPGCRPYAQAIADGEAINKCPPGGQSTINNLADLLGMEAPTLDEEHGEESEVPKVAYIREDECIGCTKCIQACPVDAILGAAKQMHTVIVSECTGCDLCVEPCPVDCIDMLPVGTGISGWKWELPKPELATNIIASDRDTAEQENAA
ncbi:electron transport complex subunit RsxB [Saccharophagus degradans]|uniref:Ion-translocating oxidoreductase complex subunit B n=2 Tax=Saccharophagus degradans TaxID=86304 RepID=Q21I19_SACD2|nr:electron transport complex subunit RsxB [Saccharophagus degradans]ABD81660.1 electron transport complex, RnfABCDGE type, B subunit [Saccharophagus degradans 2-40]MBU2986463.1 electron transport complex subunit RsxB [Saccharophagus degradans]MDO6424537.1 electron transport complex subunit RsxB [Saccharophagus degradans]MDO6608840.1 electron transport complex subunit RsxB [Saccharophagus degradans]WGP00127.1 electron transport complex subunit RsxB [Saccharophagus degradans]